MVPGNVTEVRWHVVQRFFLGKRHNLLRFSVHFAKKILGKGVFFYERYPYL